MNFVDLIAIAALIQLLAFALLVGRARVKYGIKAPAIAGNENFERAYRVQTNTIELLVIFIPALYLAAKYWPSTFAAICGTIYIIGRLVYRNSYVANPDSRSLGFLLSFAPICLLLIAALVGAIRSTIGVF